MAELREMTVAEIKALLKTSTLSKNGGIVLMKTYPLPVGVELRNTELYKGAFSCDVATYTIFQHSAHIHVIDDIYKAYLMNQRSIPGRNCVTVVSANGGFDSMMPMALRTDLVPGSISNGWFYTGLEDRADISFAVIPDDKGNEYAYFYANNSKDDPVLCSIDQVIIKIKE